MKLLYTTHDGQMTAEFEGETQKDVWRQLAAFQEVFEDTLCQTKDGKEKSSKVRFTVRNQPDPKTKKRYEYFELVCVDSDNQKLYRAKKRFGQHDNEAGTLFPHKEGWVKYDGKEEVSI